MDNVCIIFRKRRRRSSPLTFSGRYTDYDHLSALIDLLDSWRHWELSTEFQSWIQANPREYIQASFHLSPQQELTTSDECVPNGVNYVSVLPQVEWWSLKLCSNKATQSASLSTPQNRWSWIYLEVGGFRLLLMMMMMIPFQWHQLLPLSYWVINSGNQLYINIMNRLYLYQVRGGDEEGASICQNAWK